MTDARRRDAERGADRGDDVAAAQLLVERLRAGELTRERLRLAAYLDHGPARQALGEEVAVDDWVRAVSPADRRALVQAVLREEQVDPLPRGVHVAPDGSGDLTTLHPHPRVTLGDRWLEHFSCMTRLIHLSVDMSRVSDVGLQYVRGLQELETLNLRQTAVTDAGLVHLRGLSRLTHLWLNDTSIDGSGLASLEVHPRLTNLFLNNTRVDDRALRHLEALPRLEYLTLGGTRVTDRCLQSLATLPALSYVDIGLTAVSDAAVRDFQATVRRVEFDRPD